jgi:hypothetical protein
VSDVVKFVEVKVKPGVSFETCFKCPSCSSKADLKQDMFGAITVLSQCCCSISVRSSFDNSKIIVMSVKKVCEKV